MAGLSWILMIMLAVLAMSYGWRLGNQALKDHEQRWRDVAPKVSPAPTVDPAEATLIRHATIVAELPPSIQADFREIGVQEAWETGLRTPDYLGPAITNDHVYTITGTPLTEDDYAAFETRLPPEIQQAINRYRARTEASAHWHAEQQRRIDAGLPDGYAGGGR